MTEFAEEPPTRPSLDEAMALLERHYDPLTLDERLTARGSTILLEAQTRALLSIAHSLEALADRAESDEPRMVERVVVRAARERIEDPL